MFEIRLWFHWSLILSVQSTVVRHLVSWWCHQMETFSALLAICAGNSPVTGEFPTQRPVTRSFGVFFDLCPNERLSKQSWGWWFGTLSSPLWRHRNVTDGLPPNRRQVIASTNTDQVPWRIYNASSWLNVLLCLSQAQRWGPSSQTIISRWLPSSQTITSRIGCHPTDDKLKKVVTPQTVTSGWRSPHRRQLQDGGQSIYDKFKMAVTTHDDF